MTTTSASCGSSGDVLWLSRESGLLLQKEVVELGTGNFEPAIIDACVGLSRCGRENMATTS